MSDLNQKHHLAAVYTVPLDSHRRRASFLLWATKKKHAPQLDGYNAQHVFQEPRVAFGFLGRFEADARCSDSQAQQDGGTPVGNLYLFAF
jgi:hypothetical protein